jgi:hypothetical protein
MPVADAAREVEWVESSAARAPGAAIRTTAVLLAALTVLWSIGYIFGIDDSMEGFILSLLLQPFAWLAVGLGIWGNRRAYSYARCGSCLAPVPAASTVCVKCGRDIERMVTAKYTSALLWVAVILILDAALGLVITGAL